MVRCPYPLHPILPPLGPGDKLWHYTHATASCLLLPPTRLEGPQAWGLWGDNVLSYQEVGRALT